MEATKRAAKAMPRALPRRASRGASVGFLIFALCLPACRSTDGGASGIVVALESMPQNLDPRFATDAASERIGNLVFRSLTRTDASGQHVPEIALDWTLDGPRSVTFRLRTDVAFHDGRPLTADDVRATYESIRSPKTASPKRRLLDFLDGIDAPDPHTIRFRMKESYAPFLEATAIGILPRDLAAGSGREALVGSGPFRIARVEPNHEVVLEAASNRGGLPRIRFRVIPDETVRALEMRKRTVHLVQNGIEPETLATFRHQDGICVRQRPGTTFQYLGINLRDPILRDRRVRQAIAMAIDRESLVRHLFRDTARVASGLLAPGHWAFAPDVTRYALDRAAAGRLLDEAGHPDPDGNGPAMRFRLGYKTTTLASRRRLAEAVQADLATIGIGLDIRSFEWGTFYDDIRRGNFQLYALAWVGITDPDIYFEILHSTMVPPRGNNRGHFADAEIDRLTFLGRHTLDPLERQKIYGDVQRRAALELPFLPFWWEDVVVVQDDRLCGFVPYPNGDLISLRTAWWNEHAAEAPDRSGPCGCAPAAG